MISDDKFSFKLTISIECMKEVVKSQTLTFEELLALSNLLHVDKTLPETVDPKSLTSFADYAQYCLVPFVGVAEMQQPSSCLSFNYSEMSSPDFQLEVQVT